MILINKSFNEGMFLDSLSIAHENQIFITFRQGNIFVAKIILIFYSLTIAKTEMM